MIEDITDSMPHEVPGGRESQSGSRALPQPRHARLFSRHVNRLCALVVSSDDAAQQSLAEMIDRCGLMPVRAYTLGESRRILNCQGIWLVICADRLIDGKYEDLLTATSRRRIPVIVVSLAGDWPDYFKAMSAGAFDFLAYPTIPGEIPRVVNNALESHALRNFGPVKTKYSDFLDGGSL
jgi:DNA-binding NtrC family response regulator